MIPVSAIDLERFRRDLQEARMRIDLYLETPQSTGSRNDVLAEQLQTALEALRVAEEEVTAQYEALQAVELTAERRLSRYQELFDAAPDAYLITDVGGMIMEGNGAARRLLGDGSCPLVGRPMAIFVHPDERRSFRIALDDLALDAPTSRVNWRLRLATPHDDEHVVSAAVTVQTASSGDTELRWTLCPAAPPDDRDAVTRALREISGDLMSSRDVVDLLTSVSRHGANVLGAGACGVLLANPDGRLQIAAASDDDAESLELFQLEHEQGPCFDAFTSAAIVIADDLERHRARWPGFVRRARSAGLGSVLAVPILVDSDALGAMNFLRRRPGHFTDSDVLAGQALAGFAGFAVSSNRELRQSHELVGQLQHALATRVVIEQAKGMLAERRGVSPSAAFEALRRDARNNQRRLRDVCQELLERGFDVEGVDLPERHPPVTARSTMRSPSERPAG